VSRALEVLFESEKHDHHRVAAIEDYVSAKVSEATKSQSPELSYWAASLYHVRLIKSGDAHAKESDSNICRLLDFQASGIDRAEALCRELQRTDYSIKRARMFAYKNYRTSTDIDERWLSGKLFRTVFELLLSRSMMFAMAGLDGPAEYNKCELVRFCDWAKRNPDRFLDEADYFGDPVADVQLTVNLTDLEALTGVPESSYSRDTDFKLAELNRVGQNALHQQRPVMAQLHARSAMLFRYKANWRTARLHEIARDGIHARFAVPIGSLRSFRSAMDRVAFQDARRGQYLRAKRSFLGSGWQVYALRAELALENGYFVHAEHDLHEVIGSLGIPGFLPETEDNDRVCVSTLSLMGWIALTQGRYSTAEVDYRVAIAAWHKMPTRHFGEVLHAYLGCAYIYELQQRRDSALAMVKEAAALCPSNADWQASLIQLHLGRILLKSGDSAEASSILANASRIVPDDPAARCALISFLPVVAESLARTGRGKDELEVKLRRQQLKAETDEQLKRFREAEEAPSAVAEYLQFHRDEQERIDSWRRSLGPASPGGKSEPIWMQMEYLDPVGFYNEWDEWPEEV